MDIQNVSRMSQFNGMTLNAEEQAAVEIGMMERKLGENLNGKLMFWGKIFGTKVDQKTDYLIICHVDPTADFPQRRYWYCTTADFIFNAMQDLSPEYEAKAKSITDQFTGDPGWNYGVDVPEPAEGEPEVEIFREKNRLLYVIKSIDHDCGIIPRGSYIVDATKKVIANTYYGGLSYGSAGEARSYLHFRKPESLTGLAMLKRPGIIKSGDFLDCIDKDVPTAIWAIQSNSNATATYVRNLYWEGYGFYSVLNTPEYGAAYFGYGLPNYDIAFML